MSEEPDHWEPCKDSVTVAKPRVYDVDMFWHSAYLEPTAAFAEYCPIFEAGPDSTLDSEYQEWEMSQVMSLGLKLVRLRDKAPAKEFIVHIHGNEAHFRVLFEDEI